MIDTDKKEKIKEIWNDYTSSGQMVLDTKGNELPNIDKLRIEAIKSLTEIVQQFDNGEISIGEFKTSIDSFVLRNPPLHQAAKRWHTF